MKEVILGISAYYHDSAAALIIGGEIIAAAQEERFTRLKNHATFPENSIRYVLSEADIKPAQITKIAFYDKPFIKFERLLETYHAFAPKGLKSFLSALPVWIGDKLFFKRLLRKELKKMGFLQYQLYFPEHHLSHAASAFFPSPFKKAAIFTVDGVGEWTTTAIAIGNGNSIKILKELHFPHSLGLLYSAFTAYCSFKVNSGEYKLMGLAPYGNVQSENYRNFKQSITEELIDIREDGSFLLNMNYFEFATGLKMYNAKKWRALFGIAALPLGAQPKQEYADLALAIQHVVEDIILKLAKTTRELSGATNLVLAGGVALNSVANGKLRAQNIFDNQWIQPAAGDAGGSVGAALAVHHIVDGNKRKTVQPDAMKNASLGPSYTDSQIESVLLKYGAVYENWNEKHSQLNTRIAELINQNNVVGWFKGRMEFGPRALGYRSILADPGNADMQKKLNLKIKKREEFRPFAPIVLKEDVSVYFKQSDETPYMLHVVPVKEEVIGDLPPDFSNFSMDEKLKYPKGVLPAVTHVDGSARVQTVSEERNPKLHNLLKEYKKSTGIGVLINTSFNERGEPIVCSPDDAFKSFMRTEMDVLVLENFLLFKNEQKVSAGEFSRDFNLD